MLTDYSRLTAAMLDRMENAVVAQAPHLSPVVQVVRRLRRGLSRDPATRDRP